MSSCEEGQAGEGGGGVRGGHAIFKEAPFSGPYKCGVRTCRTPKVSTSFNFVRGHLLASSKSCPDFEGASCPMSTDFIPGDCSDYLQQRLLMPAMKPLGFDFEL